MNRIVKGTLVAIAAASMVTVGSSAITSAAPPVVTQDNGAFVRLLGNPADGTAKFQFGWGADTVASDAAGYWVGVYDVTHSHYVWWTETGPVELPDAMTRNARPTTELPNGEYKVVLFVREAYEPTTNLSAIEAFFTVDNSMY